MEACSGENNFCKLHVPNWCVMCHVTGTFYQKAKFKHLEERFIPVEAASTSLPQTWQAPGGQKIGGTTVDNLQVHGYSKAEFQDTPGLSAQSTLYNPLESDVKWNEQYEKVKAEASEMLVVDAMKDNPKMFPSKFGLVPAGSILSYQQTL